MEHAEAEALMTAMGWQPLPGLCHRECIMEVAWENGYTLAVEHATGDWVIIDQHGAVQARVE